MPWAPFVKAIDDGAYVVMGPVFSGSIAQTTALPKVAGYLNDTLKAKSF